jgi:hypothetical protein
MIQHPLATSLDGVNFHNPGAFWFGAVSTTVGVLLHLPMYLSGASMGYRLAGMPVDTAMLIGMFLIVVGLVSTFYGPVPPSGGGAAGTAARIRVRALEPPVEQFLPPALDALLDRQLRGLLDDGRAVARHDGTGLRFAAIGEEEARRFRDPAVHQPDHHHRGARRRHRTGAVRVQSVDSDQPAPARIRRGDGGSHPAGFRLDRLSVHLRCRLDVRFLEQQENRDPCSRR